MAVSETVGAVLTLVIAFVFNTARVVMFYFNIKK